MFIKNVSMLKNGISCSRCHVEMFSIETPFGSDYVTCPLCEHWSEHGGSSDIISDILDKREKETGIEEDLLYYCEKCNIMFRVGCTHAVNGCTDDVYHAELIKSYKVENKVLLEMLKQTFLPNELNSIIYEYLFDTFIGMPKFTSLKECEQIFQNLTLNWYCTCNKSNSQCSKGVYTHRYSCIISP